MVRILTYKYFKKTYSPSASTLLSPRPGVGFCLSSSAAYHSLGQELILTPSAGRRLSSACALKADGDKDFDYSSSAKQTRQQRLLFGQRSRDAPADFTEMKTHSQECAFKTWLSQKRSQPERPSLSVVSVPKISGSSVVLQRHERSLPHPPKSSFCFLFARERTQDAPLAELKSDWMQSAPPRGAFG